MQQVNLSIFLSMYQKPSRAIDSFETLDYIMILYHIFNIIIRATYIRKNYNDVTDENYSTISTNSSFFFLHT